MTVYGTFLDKGIYICFLYFTLPVRRYLVPTPSTKGGGGVSQPPYDLENGRLHKLQLRQAIRTIYER